MPQLLQVMWPLGMPAMLAFLMLDLWLGKTCLQTIVNSVAFVRLLQFFVYFLGVVSKNLCSQLEPTKEPWSNGNCPRPESSWGLLRATGACLRWIPGTMGQLSRQTISVTCEHSILHVDRSSNNVLIFRPTAGALSKSDSINKGTLKTHYFYATENWKNVGPASRVLRKELFVVAALREHTNEHHTISEVHV